YLVAPVAAGAIAAIIASYLYGSETVRAVPLAYAATTFGVIVGADLLRQPPLYASSLKGLYVIGGGNYSDLVYLSPLLALAVAYLFLRYTEATRVPASGGIPLDPTSPYGALAEGIRAAFSGMPEASLGISREAGHAAAEQARILLGGPPPTPGRPWQELPVPGWVTADQANLDAVSQRGPFERVEAERGAQMARALVGLGQSLTASRFATIPRRAAAFGIDLLVVLLPATLVWYGILIYAPSVTDGLKGLVLATASYGFVAFAFLYFVLLPSVTGTSVGKRIFGIEVRDRAGHKPGFLRSTVRESPKLIILSVLGVLVPVSLGILLGGSAAVTGLPSVAGLILEFVALAIIAITFALSAMVAVAAISMSSERQRVGDAWAGTWVLTRRPAPTPSTRTPASTPAPAPTGSAAPVEAAKSSSKVL
ncbi:MAG: RDD family protein, partial [Thermoplasmata archaeon]